jgi:hypothetical protein
MEKICEHCNEQFIVNRKDVVYCSASCRQMAYMERKFNSTPEKVNKKIYVIPLSDTPKDETSTDVLRNDNEASIDTLQNNEEPSIDVLEFNSKNANHTLTEFSNADKLNANESTTELIDKAPGKEYKKVSSKFLTAIGDLSNRRNYLSILNNCLYVHKNVPSYGIGMRLKCLVECLLLFSEMNLTELDDLKELCNAFTLTIGSNYYKELPAKFPYTSYLLSLRDKLKQLIIENRNDEKIQFRLSTENKIELIATRFELSHFYAKKKFCDLNFSE